MQYNALQQGFSLLHIYIIKVTLQFTKVCNLKSLYHICSYECNYLRFRLYELYKHYVIRNKVHKVQANNKVQKVRTLQLHVCISEWNYVKYFHCTILSRGLYSVDRSRPNNDAHGTRSRVPPEKTSDRKFFECFRNFPEHVFARIIILSIAYSNVYVQGVPEKKCTKFAMQLFLNYLS